MVIHRDDLIGIFRYRLVKEGIYAKGELIALLHIVNRNDDAKLLVHLFSSRFRLIASV